MLSRLRVISLLLSMPSINSCCCCLELIAGLSILPSRNGPSCQQRTHQNLSANRKYVTHNSNGLKSISNPHWACPAWQLRQAQPLPRGMNRERLSRTC